MAASPVLSFPPDILTFAPEWVGCGADPYVWAFDDPPSALTPVSALVTTSASSDATSIPSSKLSAPVQQTTPGPTPGGTASILPVTETGNPSRLPYSSSQLDPVALPDPGETTIRHQAPLPGGIMRSQTSYRPDQSSFLDPISPSATTLFDSPLRLDPVSFPDRPSSDLQSLLDTRFSAISTSRSSPLGPPAFVQLDTDQSALSGKSTDSQATIKSANTEGLANNVPSDRTSEAFLFDSTDRSQQVYTSPTGTVSGQETSHDTMTQGYGPAATTLDAAAFTSNRPVINVINGGPVYKSSLPYRDASLTLPLTDEQYPDADNVGDMGVGGDTTKDDQATMVDSHGVSTEQGRLASSDATSKAMPYTQTTATDLLPSVIGKKFLKFDGDGAIVLDGKTMFPGQETTLDGKPMSIAASGVVYDNTTYFEPASFRSGAVSTGQPITKDREDRLHNSERKDVLGDISRDSGDPTAITQESAMQPSFVTSTDVHRAVIPSAPLETSMSASISLGSGVNASPSQISSRGAARLDAESIISPKSLVNKLSTTRISSETSESLGRPSSDTVDEIKASLNNATSVQLEETAPNSERSSPSTIHPKVAISSSATPNMSWTTEQQTGRNATAREDNNQASVTDSAVPALHGEFEKVDGSLDHTTNHLQLSPSPGTPITRGVDTVPIGQSSATPFNAPADPDNPKGIGAMIMSAFGNVPPQTTETPPETELEESSVSANASRDTFVVSGDVGHSFNTLRWLDNVVGSGEATVKKRDMKWVWVEEKQYQGVPSKSVQRK
ncbi:MAG: hypothetical protein Q9204_004621 [Flavoplaca sp. TL-2023a]